MTGWMRLTQRLGLLVWTVALTPLLSHAQAHPRLGSPARAELRGHDSRPPLAHPSPAGSRRLGDVTPPGFGGNPVVAGTDRRSTTGTIVVRTPYPRAIVELDGRRRGRVSNNALQFNVPEGRHVVTILAHGARYSYEVEVHAGGVYTLNVETATLSNTPGRVRVRGSGALVGGSGSVDRRRVTRRLVRQRYAMSLCYEHALARDPSHHGELRVTFTILSNGDVDEVTGAGNISDAVQACVLEVVRTLRIVPGPTGGSVRLQYRFTFEPAD